MIIYLLGSWLNGWIGNGNIEYIMWCHLYILSSHTATDRKWEDSSNAIQTINDKKVTIKRAKMYTIAHIYKRNGNVRCENEKININE